MESPQMGVGCRTGMTLEEGNRHLLSVMRSRKSNVRGKKVWREVWTPPPISVIEKEKKKKKKRKKKTTTRRRGIRGKRGAAANDR